MANTSTLVQSGENLYILADDGAGVELTEPSTVTISTDRMPRFEVNGVHAIVVNSVSQPLIVDDAGIVLYLSPNAPTAAPTVAVGTAGALTGTYGVKYTFAIRDLNEVIVAESGFSASASVALTSDKLAVSNLQTLTGLTSSIYDDRYEVVRRVYRTAAGGSVYFLWYTVEDNSTTSFEDDATDAAISALAADSLETAPFLSHIASFKGRLYGIDNSTAREVLRYSETDQRWAWPSANRLPLSQVKGDAQSGATALMPIRNALGIAKSNMLIQLTGTDDASHVLTVVSTSIGAVNQESAALYRDQWYFLGPDGVYRWGEGGVESISDPRDGVGGVRSWFTTDTYFDRDEFINAKGEIDIDDKSYKLQLTNLAGEAVWVEYDIESGTWWGPHRTDDPDYVWTSLFRLGSSTPLLGWGTADGHIVVDTETRSDNGATAIETEGILAPIRAADPPVTTYFGTLTTEVDPQAGGTLSVYPTVGELSESEDAVMSHDLTLASSGLGRLGYGRYLKLRFFHNTIDQLIQLLGFEVDPVNIVGRRQ